MNAPLRKALEQRVSEIEQGLGIRGELKVRWYDNCRETRPWEELDEEEREGWLRESGVWAQDEPRVVILECEGKDHGACASCTQPCTRKDV